MHETHDKTHVMKTIETIKASEEEAENTIQNAKAQADEIVKKGKERIAKLKSDTNQEIVMVKNRVLQKGKIEVEKEIEQMLAKARQSGAQAKNRKFSAKELSEFLKELLSV